MLSLSAGPKSTVKELNLLKFLKLFYIPKLGIGLFLFFINNNKKIINIF